MDKLIVSIIRFFTKGILLATLISFLVCLFVYSRSYPEHFNWSDTIWFGAAIFGCIGIYKFWVWIIKQSKSSAIIILTILNLLGCLVVLLTFDTQPVSDYNMIWKGAQMVANGTYDASDPNLHIYYKAYNWQGGMMGLEALIISIFGPNFYVLKLLSCLCVLVGSYLIYKVTGQYGNEGQARGAYVLAALFLPYFLAVGQFTNHQIGTVFLLLSLYYLKYDSFKAALLAGVFAACLNFCRAIALIVILAAICIYLYRCFKNNHRLKILLQGLTFIGAYLICMSIMSALLIHFKVTETSLSSNNVPYYKFHKGLIPYESPWEDMARFDNNLELFSKWEKEEVLKAISERPVETMIYTTNKMVRFLGLYDGQLEHTYNHQDENWLSYPVRAFNQMGWMQYIIYVILAWFGLKIWKRTNELTVYEIWFIGNTLVYIFIEAISHYRYEGYIFLFSLGGFGLFWIHEKLENRKLKV